MEVFHSQMVVYKWIGIERFQPSKMKKCFYLLKIWNSFAILFCVSTAINFASTTNDIREIAESMGPAFTGIVMIIKYVIFSIRTEDIFGIMDDIEKLTVKYQHLRNASQTISKANNLTVLITTPLKWGCIVAASFYIIKPFGLDFVYYFFYNMQSSRGVPLKAKFPYDETKSPAYELTFFVQSYTAILVGTIVYVMSVNFSSFTLSISAHLDVLRDSISLKVDEFVKYHLKIINITKRLNEIYSFMIFVEFFIISTTLIVVLGLSVIAAEGFLELVVPFLHISGALTDVACHSFGSQKMLDSSEAICEEAYNIDKDYLMVIMTAQQKLRVTTPFFEASFETFSFMLSRSWSFITLLNSFI